MSEIAHLGPVELLTPDADASLHFFSEVLGMEIEGRDGRSVYLRGWGDYQRYSLKLTESDTSGMAWLGIRAWSPEALERRVAAVRAAGLGGEWTADGGERGRGAGYRFRGPDGHRFELYHDVERYEPPEHLRPSLKNQPQRYTGRGAAIKRLDHVNIVSADVRADRGRGRGYRFSGPDGHPFELYYEVERYAPPEHLRPALKNQPQRYTGRGAAVKRLDHVNVLSPDVRPDREFATDVLGYRLYERIELDDGTEAGAWLSATIAAHELIYTKDAYGAHGRLHHLAFWVDTREECLRAADLFLDGGIHIEAAPSKHAIAQGFFLYGIEPGGNRIEVTTGGYFVFDPDHPPTVWTEEERRKGQAWGVKTVESFHTYGTPPVEARAAG